MIELSENMAGEDHEQAFTFPVWGHFLGFLQHSQERGYRTLVPFSMKSNEESFVY